MEARVELVCSGDRTRTSCTHERICIRAANDLTNWASQTDSNRCHSSTTHSAIILYYIILYYVIIIIITSACNRSMLPSNDQRQEGTYGSYLAVTVFVFSSIMFVWWFMFACIALSGTWYGGLRLRPGLIWWACTTLSTAYTSLPTSFSIHNVYRIRTSSSAHPVLFMKFVFHSSRYIDDATLLR